MNISKLQEHLWDTFKWISTPTEFLAIFETVKNDPVLAEILAQWADELQDKNKKIMYASTVLSEEMFTAIWVEWLTAADMTLDKICTIWIGDPETVGLMDGGLMLELVQSMSWEWLAHAGMTVDKITLLWFWITPEQVREIGAENIAKMSKKELNDRCIF